MRGSIRDQLQPQIGDDAEYRLEGQRLVKAHAQSISDLDKRIGDLQHRRLQRQGLLARAELQAKGIRPCLVCKRLVPSPCNSRGQMQSEGPWDSFCADYMENRAVSAILDQTR